MKEERTYKDSKNQKEIKITSRSLSYLFRPLIT